MYCTFKFKKLRDIIEGPWLQKDIKLPTQRSFLENVGCDFFTRGQLLIWVIIGIFQGGYNKN